MALKDQKGTLGSQGGPGSQRAIDHGISWDQRVTLAGGHVALGPRRTPRAPFYMILSMLIKKGVQGLYVFRF